MNVMLDVTNRRRRATADDLPTLKPRRRRESDQPAAGRRSSTTLRLILGLECPAAGSVYTLVRPSRGRLVGSAPVA
jgi:hypothetical protein